MQQKKLQTEPGKTFFVFNGIRTHSLSDDDLGLSEEEGREKK